MTWPHMFLTRSPFPDRASTNLHPRHLPTSWFSLWFTHYSVSSIRFPHSSVTWQLFSVCLHSSFLCHSHLCHRCNWYCMSALIIFRARLLHYSLNCGGWILWWLGDFRRPRREETVERAVEKAVYELRFSVLRSSGSSFGTIWWLIVKLLQICVGRSWLLIINS